MGKKNKKKDKKKQGLGMAKTLAKTAKKAEKRQKKKAKAKGEEDLDSILADIKQKDAELVAITIEPCEHPSGRCNLSMVPHPFKDELLLFGGEYWDGKNQNVYSDTFIYHINRNDWKRVSSPTSPQPRSAHQAVPVAREGGQVYVFGGEFTSRNGMQFKHFRDLWRLNLSDYSWQQIDTKKKGPSPRSGHRMVQWKNKIVLFGGFFDSGKQVTYFNDLWVFDLDEEKWTRAPSCQNQPSARSGFSFAVDGDKAVLYGGFCTTKLKNVDKGKVLSDVWTLDLHTLKWVRPHVQKKNSPTPRSGCAMTVHKNRCLLFGGVRDSDDTSEALIKSSHFNDLMSLGFHGDTGHWARCRPGLPKRKKAKKERVPKQRLEDVLQDAEVESFMMRGYLDAEMPSEELCPIEGEKIRDYFLRTATHWLDMAAFDFEEESVSSSRALGHGNNEDGVPLSKREDQDKLGRARRQQAFDYATDHYNETEAVPAVLDEEQQAEAAAADAAAQALAAAPVRRVRVKGARVAPRRSAAVCVRKDTLFVFGGVLEQKVAGGGDDAEKEVTFYDLHSLNLKAEEDGWQRRVAMDLSTQEWLGQLESDDEDDMPSDFEDDAEDEEDGTGDYAVDRENLAGDDDDDYASGMEGEEEGDEEAPDLVAAEDADPLQPREDEKLRDYFQRTNAHWLGEAEGESDNAKQARKLAFQLAAMRFEEA